MNDRQAEMYLEACRNEWPPPRVVDAHGNEYEPAVTGYLAKESEAVGRRIYRLPQGSYEVKR